MPELPKTLPLPEAVNGDWINYKCPWCYEGSRNKAPFGINVKTGWCGCFRCGHYFRLDDAHNLEAILPDLKRVNTPRVPHPTSDDLLPVPDFLYRVFEERGLAALPTIQLYEIGWDGERICVPTSLGLWRRSIVPGTRSKVLAPPGAKGLLGHHRLRPGAHVVVTEGDYAAFSIPAPWVGVAIGGQHINRHQAELIVDSQPASVLLYLDAGATPLATVRRLGKAGVRPKVVRVQDLPERTGPDDVPVAERIRRILEVNS